VGNTNKQAPVVLTYSIRLCAFLKIAVTPKNSVVLAPNYIPTATTSDEDMAVPRAMSSAVAFPADEEGWTVLDERDTALCASLRGGPTGGIRGVRVVPMDGYSDHELLAISYDGPAQLTAATWNTGMTGKDPASGPDIMTASVSPPLEAALRRAMDMTVPRVIAEATAGERLPPPPIPPPLSLAPFQRTCPMPSSRGSRLPGASSPVGRRTSPARALSRTPRMCASESVTRPLGL